MDIEFVNLIDIYNPAAVADKANDWALTDPVTATENAQWANLLGAAMPIDETHVAAPMFNMEDGTNVPIVGQFTDAVPQVEQEPATNDVAEPNLLAGLFGPDDLFGDNVPEITQEQPTPVKTAFEQFKADLEASRENTNSRSKEANAARAAARKRKRAEETATRSLMFPQSSPAPPQPSTLALPQSSPQAPALASPLALPRPNPLVLPQAAPLALSLPSPPISPLDLPQAAPLALPQVTPQVGPQAITAAAPLDLPLAAPLDPPLALPQAPPLALSQATSFLALPQTNFAGYGSGNNVVAAQAPAQAQQAPRGGIPQPHRHCRHSHLPHHHHNHHNWQSPAQPQAKRQRTEPAPITTGRRDICVNAAKQSAQTAQTVADLTQEVARLRGIVEKHEYSINLLIATWRPPPQAEAQPPSSL
ncbi:hypothetical protein EDB81DRAFT_908747 [Dactylonectria macrodidyma]|uniref:Uncharacterized protein n=1 Tax=Dactylonectria macrodidyma TaxID=307937 RepID=A0A9P9FQR1_9HYPO|nr:hypothetical protein EDB81DRAFT_908747 [Dactylonectria macrodidyma]